MFLGADILVGKRENNHLNNGDSFLADVQG